MSLKDELIKKAETQLEEWEKQADSLKAKAKAKEAEPVYGKPGGDQGRAAAVLLLWLFRLPRKRGWGGDSKLTFVNRVPIYLAKAQFLWITCIP